MRNGTTLLACASLLLLVAAGGVGCSTAQADALDVTYYYLPG